MLPLNPHEKQATTYAVPLWLRDQQILTNIGKTKGRLQPIAKRSPPDNRIAVVCFGPTLNDTWERIKDFKYIISCSGAHKFLLEHGIVPTWDLNVDPRAHKIELMGPPHKDVEYLVASTCSPKLLDHLEGYNVKLWHIFADSDDAHRVLPRGEWWLTGGCSAGLRCMTMARFLGFTELHIFGMDGAEGKSGKHAAAHPMQPKKNQPCEYGGVTYYTTASMLECARQTFPELNAMPDVDAVFYGDSLVQAMAKNYVKEPVKGDALIAFFEPELISPEYREMNMQMHRDKLAYGVGGDKHVKVVLDLVKQLDAKSVLDFGCGKGMLAKELPFPIWEYDPAIPGKDGHPRAAELVVATDVLEHIEPDRLDLVLGELRRCTLRVGYFVIHTGPAVKTLPDGRNAHLIQQNKDWWINKLGQYFAIGENFERGPLIHVVVSKAKKKKATGEANAQPG